MSISTEQSYGEGIERSHYISHTKEATDHFIGQHRNQYYAGRKHTEIPSNIYGKKLEKRARASVREWVANIKVAIHDT